MMAVVRLVEKFDQERSVFEWNSGIDGVTKVPYHGPYISRLYDIHMLPDMPSSFHAFLFARIQSLMIFDEVLVDEWRDRRFLGWRFTPLQRPTAKEHRVQAMDMDQYEYWRREKEGNGG